MRVSSAMSYQGHGRLSPPHDRDHRLLQAQEVDVLLVSTVVSFVPEPSIGYVLDPVPIPAIVVNHSLLPG